MLLYIVRHADPIYETDSLTDRGKLQARALSKRLRKANIDRIFCSPMGRAKETAEYTCRLLGIKKNIEDWTREIHPSQAPFVKENGEAFLERLGYKKEADGYRILQNNEERVALFCHGTFIIVWLSELLGVPLSTAIASFGVTHTGVTIISFPNNPDGICHPYCLCLSDISHLYAADLDLIFDNKIEM